MLIIDSKLKFKSNNFEENNPKMLVIHHALHNKCTIYDVHKWHLDKGWLGFGYHYYIDKNGKIYKGREIKHNGAHVKEDKINYQSIGICLEGCYTDYLKMTEKIVPGLQINSLVDLSKYLMNLYKIREIYPHSKFANYKDCPGKYFPFTSYLTKCFVTNNSTSTNTISNISRVGLDYLKQKKYILSNHEPNELVTINTLGLILRNYDNENN